MLSLNSAFHNQTAGAERLPVSVQNAPVALEDNKPQQGQGDRFGQQGFVRLRDTTY